MTLSHSQCPCILSGYLLNKCTSKQWYYTLEMRTTKKLQQADSWEDL